MPKIKITVSGELMQVIRDYADNHDYTIASAAADLCAIGAEATTLRPIKAREYDWGGDRKSGTSQMKCGWCGHLQFVRSWDEECAKCGECEFVKIEKEK